jgi:predicted xylose isomerase-like sugar epimerase
LVKNYSISYRRLSRIRIRILRRSKMEKYLIVTDTTSAMDQEIAQKNGIELISLSVIVDGHEYKDQIDISTKQLYDYLRW